MIADTAVLSTSPWHHDQLFRSMDLPGLEVDVMTMDEPFETNLHVRGRRHSSPGHDMHLVDTAMSGTSCGGSIASSDCSDEPYVDIEGCVDGGSLFPISDDMTSSLLNVLGDGCYTGSGLTGLGWSDSELECTVGDLEVEVVSDTNSDILPRMPNAAYHPQPARKRRCSEGLTDKTWGEMEACERLSEIEDLTNIISSQMGLREQLEVIRIINPHASVLPTDTEFVIELEYLTDEKLREVREFVQKHVPDTCTSSSSSSSNNYNNNNNMVSTQQKKHTKKQRRQEQKELRQRQRREYRQTMKEKRSGLFKKEEVVSLSNGQPSETGEEEEDIDILT